MTHKRITKDEQYLITLYEEASKLGDPYHELDRYQIGQVMGQNDKSVDNIVKLLAQTNFIKKGSGDSIYITGQGESLVQELS